VRGIRELPMVELVGGEARLQSRWASGGGLSLVLVGALDVKGVN
jgi:hypothetical protein